MAIRDNSNPTHVFSHPELNTASADVCHEAGRDVAPVRRMKWWLGNVATQGVLAGGLWASWQFQTPGSACFGGVIFGLLLGELLWRGAYEAQRSIVRRFVDATERCEMKRITAAGAADRRPIGN